jgi:hypothetical protein
MSNGDYYQCLYIFPLIFTHDITEILLKVALNTQNPVTGSYSLEIKSTEIGVFFRKNLFSVVNNVIGL